MFYIRLSSSLLLSSCFEFCDDDTMFDCVPLDVVNSRRLTFKSIPLFDPALFAVSYGGSLESALLYLASISFTSLVYNHCKVSYTGATYSFSIKSSL